MENRRAFLGLAAASLLPAMLDAQGTASQAAGELARHTLTGPLENFDAVLVRLTIPAGRGLGSGHRHPGPVLGYVEEGQLRFAINNEPERVVQAGETFFEPTGAAHTTHGSARADGPTRVLVFMIVPKGSALTMPV